MDSLKAIALIGWALLLFPYFGATATMLQDTGKAQWWMWPAILTVFGFFFVLIGAFLVGTYSLLAGLL